MSVTAFPPRGLTSATARALTDSIKTDAENLWRRLLDAYERGAHTALGYSSWGDYMEAEFGTKASSAYRVLDAGRVARAIEAHSQIGERPKTASAARALVPVLRQKGEEAVAEAWAEVVDEHGGDATAEQVEESVGRRTTNPEPERIALTKEQEKFARALRYLQAQCEYVSAVLAARTNKERARARRVLDIDDATRDEWNVSIRAIDNAGRQLRRRVTNRRTP